LRPQRCSQEKSGIALISDPTLNTAPPSSIRQFL
jgi:hypothetical protein